MVGDAQQSVTYADRSGDAFQRMGKRTRLADALHPAGRRVEAETRAEHKQAERQPDYPLLYSLSGFRYCDLLLAAPERAAWQLRLRGAAFTPLQPPNEEAAPDERERGSGINAALQSCRTVSQRAAQTLEWAEMGGQGSLLDIALDHLTLGRAALYAAILARSGAPVSDPASMPAPQRAGPEVGAPDALETARRELDAAVAGLRRVGTQEFIVRGLLTRAWLRFLTGARNGPESAQEDLDGAWEIAERGPMRLFLVDIHLYRARLFGSQRSEVGGQKSEASGSKYPWDSPAADLAAAEKLINDCGYHRRDEELADAKKAILDQ